jgi:hypothetical protein
MMLLPHLLEDEIGGLSPSVGNIAVAAGAELGYSAESQKTVEYAGGGARAARFHWPADLAQAGACRAALTPFFARGIGGSNIWPAFAR